MPRSFVPLMLFAVFGVACAGASTGETGVSEPAVQPAAAVIESTPPTSTTAGIVIPNVSLTLADGSTFDFAEIDTPVMVVFWAEW